MQRLLTEHCKNYCAITHNLEENMVLYSLDMLKGSHGNTYSEAAKNGQEVLELLIESATQDGEPLPTPKIHAA
jgi:predicted RNase H-like HicB family nuclease